MHYSYDPLGRLREACFAQSPDPNYTPTGGATYYPAPGSSTHFAITRARAYYAYDPGGRVTSLNYWWDTANTSTTYTSSAIMGCSYSYDSTLKLRNGATLTDSVLNTSHTEAYGYDSSLDYLTSVNYVDGLSNATDSWTYDAGRNRASDANNSGTWSYDSLDRMTASPMGSYTNDILGNRMGAPGSVSMGWDALNRMTSLTNSGGCWNYTYRADGLRTLKSGPSATSTAYRYDGQMGFEDVDTANSTTTTTDYGLGARGIDWISVGASVGYPVYDGHGSMVATLAKSGSTFSIGNRRSFDAWGSIRSGSASGDPKGRYCANLGHKHDDESGLIYMRARYCEPSNGRFLSEDPERNGANWFPYCNCNPLNNLDDSGEDSYIGTAGALTWFIWLLYKFAGTDNYTLALGIKFVVASITGAYLCYVGGNTGSWLFKAARAIAGWANEALNLPINAVKISVITGYMLFVTWFCAELDDWAFGPGG